MKASVVICTYAMSRRLDLLEAVDSVLRQSYSEREIIVVVDNDVEVYEVLRRTLNGKVTMELSRSQRGISAARNKGVEASCGEVVAFLDDDAIATREWLEQLMANYRDPDVMAVGGRALPLWQCEPPAWLPDELFWAIGCTYRGYADSTAEVRNIHGNTMSFRRKVFKLVGPFSPFVGHNGNLLGGDETELCVRLATQLPKAKILYEPRAVIFHKVPADRCTLGYLMRRAYGEGVSKALIRSMVSCRDFLLSDERRHLGSLARVAWRALKSPMEGGLRRSLGSVLAVALVVSSAAVGFGLTRAGLLGLYATHR